MRTLASGVSRGTELLVHRHQVPPEIAPLMRAPYQVGDLPGPVKYGYLNVGVVEAGPAELQGRRVFCLYPHQDRYVVPAAAVVPVPDDVPTHRAVLAGTVETAVNALWDAAPRIGDRVAVVGAGMVGLAVALLLRRHPLQHLEVVETSASRREQVRTLGLTAVEPDQAVVDCDLTFHTSATSAGLTTCLDLLGVEGEVVEMSWYGTRTPEVPLGGAFHAKRLSVRASQVSRVSPARSARRGYADRLAVALAALADDAFDELLSPAVDLADLPATMVELADGRRDAVCQLVTYPDPSPDQQE
ncbi:zinc-binding alcohol dehydrogenase [Arsenicicoccus cauae]|uniref:zinc-dependent alcohol dehydrogenase n=1 Tax=Arsenicicoccus cauae TaxID=2663847 RepID=UPI0025936231|nr:zinc-binding alcohol dehydrogenase [Arsenicicoccus cauae]